MWQLEVMGLLHRAGASLDMKNRKHETATWIAAAHGQVRVPCMPAEEVAE